MFPISQQDSVFFFQRKHLSTFTEKPLHYRTLSSTHLIESRQVMDDPTLT